MSLGAFRTGRTHGRSVFRGGPFLRAALALLAASGFTACSLRRFAVDRAGDALAGAGSTFAGEEDPELAKAAAPFALKSIEALLAESPRHRGLLLAACSGFAQYAYAFVQQEADLVEAQDLPRARELRARAKQLYLRARDYGLRGLEAERPGFRARLQADPGGALASLTRGQVPLLYYTAAAWAGAFALDVADSSLSVDQTAIERMMRRALELDEAWEGGAIHEFLGAWEAGHAGAGGSIPAARGHFQRALVLAEGRRVSVLVAMAESLAVAGQDRKAFEARLGQALALDTAGDPSRRLANLVAQRRARWLLSREEELFADGPPKEEKAP